MKKNLGLIAALACITSVSHAQFRDVTTPVKLDGTVNTIDAEESIPVFSKDSSILYFVRTFDPKNEGGEYDQDIWFSTRDENGKYTDCERLKSLNNKFNNAILGLDNTGNTMYLLNAYDGKKDQEKGLAVSTKSGKNWSKPEEINIPGLDIDGNAYGFHVSGDGKTVIISQFGETSLGEEDLYVSEKSGGAWSKPVHMGNVINSTGFEISPFLSELKDTLFFSSNGMGGEGDADIFYSVKQGSWTNWSTPVNLGAPINSPKFDAYFTYSGNDIYWSSNRDNERSDIYHTTVPYFMPPCVITATGKDVSTYGGKDGSIDATSSGGVAPYTYLWSNGMTVEDPTGLPKGQYSVVVTDKMGQTASTNVFIDEPKPVIVAKRERDYLMTHYFGYNADKLDPENEKLLAFMNGIEDQMKNGRKITVEIKSAASYVPTNEFKSNDQLANSRAEKIKKMLQDYYSSKGLGSELSVVITETFVGGPLYENDPDNIEKYQPFQYIALSTK